MVGGAIKKVKKQERGEEWKDKMGMAGRKKNGKEERKPELHTSIHCKLS